MYFLFHHQIDLRWKDYLQQSYCEGQKYCNLQFIHGIREHKKYTLSFCVSEVSYFTSILEFDETGSRRSCYETQACAQN